MSHQVSFWYATNELQQMYSYIEFGQQRQLYCLNSTGRRPEELMPWPGSRPCIRLLTFSRLRDSLHFFILLKLAQTGKIILGKLARLCHGEIPICPCIHPSLHLLSERHDAIYS